VSQEILLAMSGKSPLEARASRLDKEGRLADRHTTLGAGCGGRNMSKDERQCCGRRSHVVLISRRRYQVCDLMMSQTTVTRKPDRRGERGGNR